MNNFKYLSNLLVNDKRAITVAELIAWLELKNPDAKVFVYNSKLKIDLPLELDDLYDGDNDLEIFIGNEK